MDLKSLDVDFLDFIGNQQSQYLEKKSAWIDEIKDDLINGVKLIGDTMPWSKSHEIFRFRPKEVTLWAGINGHGKSELTSMVALWLSRLTKVCIASFEMNPTTTLHRMVRQAAGCDNVSPEYAERFLLWRDSNMHIYDQTDTVDPQSVLGLINYSAKELGIKHMFIDSLVKCGLSTDDYNGQKEFVDKLCWSAKHNKIHIHLVHHIRKNDAETKLPDKLDIKGAGEITDLVDNAVVVWRNKPKEIKMQKLALANEPLADENTKPDTILNVVKQRNGEWEGRINLWFHKASKQYHGKLSNSPMLFNID